MRHAGTQGNFATTQAPQREDLHRLQGAEAFGGALDVFAGVPNVRGEACARPRGVSLDGQVRRGLHAHRPEPDQAACMVALLDQNRHHVRTTERDWLACIAEPHQAACMQHGTEAGKATCMCMRQAACMRTVQEQFSDAGAP